MFSWFKKKEEEPQYEWEIIGYGIMNDKQEVYTLNDFFAPYSHFQVENYRLYQSKEDAERAKEKLYFEGLKVFAAKRYLRKE